MDKLSELLIRNTLTARIFHNGTFCGSTAFVDDAQGSQLHVVQSGTVSFEHDDETAIVASVPTLLFYPRGMTHRLNVVSESAVLLCAQICFEGGNDNLLARALPAVIAIPLEGASFLNRTLALMFDEAAVQQSGGAIILNSLCNVLIAQIIRHLFDHNELVPGLLAGLADIRVSRALHLIHGAPAQPWRVDSLAMEAGMSRSKFAHHFRAVVGVTPALYLTRWRMIVAQGLLKSGLAVGAVGAAVGYASQPAFTRAFNETTGASPRRWLGLQKAGESKPAPARHRT